MSSIFHFTNAQNGFEILSKMKLQFNNVINTNDPWESKLRFFSICNLTGAGYADGISGLKNILQDISAFNLLNDKSINLFKKFLVLCFTCSFNYNNRRVHGYNQPRMWSQYGENHKGFCFEVDEKKIIKLIVSSYSNNFIKYEKVTYKDKFEKIEYSLSINGKFERFVDLHYKNIFFQKNINWSDEHEYRILIKSAQKIEVSINDCIKAIYVGENFNSAFIPLLDHYSGKLQVPIYKIISRDLFLDREFYNNFQCI
ncbi:MAG: DUF2971 domain-containing protein [Paludibacter sp.]|nr:DUF2971 domain-containing protein [Paludibacter sp.]